jgi:hypothetical protein
LAGPVPSYRYLPDPSSIGDPSPELQAAVVEVVSD